MESSPTPASAMSAPSPASSSRSRDNRLLVGFDLPASWGYRRPMAFCKDPDSSPPAAAAAVGDEALRNSSRSPPKAAPVAAPGESKHAPPADEGAAAEESARKQYYQLRDRRGGRDGAEDAQEHRKLWNMDGGGSSSGGRISAGFSVELTKQEIEVDFLAMTGKKPPRRYKRRPKVVQRQINSISPGEFLSEVNRDRYKVNEKGGF
ncbi:hypothetical protein CFC21_003844 [Triticum aestivum]|uniref:Uncharacterized protein n=2 Tax=Triticum TaxID=4564 RepID=A0A9R0QJ66_TRITD|nr:uncharacterized protein LOC123180672 [Triticum aestivum]KAF6986053.1 hypothetical protein CFC21_003844 [Triticum aestivum]VAH10983.1 unnamed protein product [Triticum turgidum subsp. durum]